MVGCASPAPTLGPADGWAVFALGSSIRPTAVANDVLDDAVANPYRAEASPMPTPPTPLAAHVFRASEGWTYKEARKAADAGSLPLTVFIATMETVEPPDVVVYVGPTDASFPRKGIFRYRRSATGELRLAPSQSSTKSAGSAVPMGAAASFYCDGNQCYRIDP